MRAKDLDLVGHRSTSVFVWMSDLRRPELSKPSLPPPQASDSPSPQPSTLPSPAPTQSPAPSDSPSATPSPSPRLAWEVGVGGLGNPGWGGVPPLVIVQEDAGGYAVLPPFGFGCILTFAVQPSMMNA